VTELEPLIAYIHSGIRVSELSEDEFAKLRNDLEKELKEKGRSLSQKILVCLKRKVACHCE
jgi:histidinol phosphatase-like enzyme